MYNGFLSQLLTSQYNGNEIGLKPNPKNRVTQGRLKMNRFIDDSADELEMLPEEVALDIVVHNRGRIEKYVLGKGDIPKENPVELAMQTWLLREQDIKAIQDATDLNREDAEIYLEQAEDMALEENHPDADQFLESIIGAVTGVVKKAVAKGAAKRAAKGKKAGLLGGLNKVLNGQPYQDVQQAVQNPDVAKEVLTEKTDVEDLLNDTVNRVRNEEKKKEIQKMLPYIIGGVILLILIIVLVMRKSS